MAALAAFSASIRAMTCFLSMDVLPFGPVVEELEGVGTVGMFLSAELFSFAVPGLDGRALGCGPLVLSAELFSLAVPGLDGRMLGCGPSCVVFSLGWSDWGGTTLIPTSS